MGSIDKLSNGRWRARYRDPGGRSRSRTFDRKAEAERFLATTATDMHRGDWVDPKLRRARFDEWADAFEDGLVRLAPTTARRYPQIDRLFLGVGDEHRLLVVSQAPCHCFPH